MKTDPQYDSDLFFACGEVASAERLVKRYHYSKRMPGSIALVATMHKAGGLFGDFGDCVAACFFSSPPTRWSEPVVELTRLVRVDGNKFPLTKLVSFACKQLKRRGFDLAVSFADSTQDHHGGIYQACSWNYHGKRDRRMDGLIIGGKFIPGRTCNALYGTRSPSKLLELKPEFDIEPHYDEGKHLYWKALSKDGAKKAKRLELESNRYPKPDCEIAVRRLRQEVLSL